jgi:superfamily II DNA or RNA helicase
MARASRKTSRPARAGGRAKYDSHNQVLDKTYGALADLRRELADSREAVAERTELLKMFAACKDPQRSWLLLEDYFERLSLSRKDFTSYDWWSRLLNAAGQRRLEETALLFLRSARALPTELSPYANLERFAEIEAAEKEQEVAQQLEGWLLPAPPEHLDAPRAKVRVVAEPVPSPEHPGLHQLAVRLLLDRPRAGEKERSIKELVDLTNRATHEEELFSREDWAFITWLAGVYGGQRLSAEISLSGGELLHWLAQWGYGGRIELEGEEQRVSFDGQMAEVAPNLEKAEGELCLGHHLTLPDGSEVPIRDVRFFVGPPSMLLTGSRFYLIRKMPPTPLLDYWREQPAVPVRVLGHRLLAHLRKTGERSGSEWDGICVVHTAVPKFIFELVDEVIRVRLMAYSDRGKTTWSWTGHEWQADEVGKSEERPEILDDPRLGPAVDWLKRFDWFTPEPGLWVGDANERFLGSLAQAWGDRPEQAEYLGNPAFQRLFLSPRRLKPKLVLHGSGIDWLSVSAEWEQEGMRLSPADLQRLTTASGRFVKLPDGGWVQLDADAVEKAQETMADLGLDGLVPVAQKVGMLQATHLEEDVLGQFTGRQAKALRQRLASFKGVKATSLPRSVQAELRPYQKAGFDFLCHLARLRLGGILADDMGLGKTLQTLSWVAWLKEQSGRKSKPSVVICPASVLHNWQREAQRFTPHLKVLVLESGSARHNLRGQIPEHDLIVTNYALLRRDLEELQKFDFKAIILDEAQFIKNPTAQVTQSVKQLQSELRLALTGTPLENRMLDLWSIADFVQPGYLGSQAQFTEAYEPKSAGEDAAVGQKLARKRLAAKIRPLMLRRLKKQVAKDLPDRIEIRRDCELGELQKKLYLAELRRSRDKVMQTIAEKGVAKSKIHVLAALTRLRQICCHPVLVGNDSVSGKTETLFELLEPLLAEGQKVLLFSQFVQMLELLEKECKERQIPTHILTGETKNRQEVVSAFQNDPNAGVFLLSLRAAGTGLNLTTASYVVLYDPWWNPAVEAQAIDRSHRIGQTRTVNAYRLITPGTVEEKIWELQQSKAQTISDVLGEEGFARSLSKADLDYLFSED